MIPHWRGGQVAHGVSGCVADSIQSKNQGAFKVINIKIYFYKYKDIDVNS